MSGWKAFMSWAGVGVLWGFTALAMMSIGILVLPVAIVVTIAASRRLRAWPEILGLCAGPVFVLQWLAWRAWSLPACDSHRHSGAVFSSAGRFSITQPGVELTFTGTFSCTSMNAAALLLAGSVLALAALIAYRACISKM